MNLFFIIVGVLILLFLFNSTKHHLHFKFKRTVLLLVLFFILIMVLSVYFDMSVFFGNGSIFAKTGAAVFSDVKESFIDKPILKEGTVSSIKETITDKASKIIDSDISLPGGYSVIKNKP